MKIESDVLKFRIIAAQVRKAGLTAFLAVVLCSVSVTRTYARSLPFFCTEAGTVLDYERRYVSDGKLKWLHRMTVLEVDRIDSLHTAVRYESDFRRPGGKRLYGGPVRLRVEISDGNVNMNLAETLGAVLHNMFPKAALKSDGGITVLPAGLKPGDVLPDAHSTAHLLGMTYTVSVTERRVLRTETIETPAGRFGCVVVAEHKEEHAPVYNRSTTAYTWYCPGYGMIRHDTYDGDMRLQTTEQLVSVGRTDDLQTNGIR
ncbi:MAG: hypothetical protein MJZ06_01875 [Bacteroidaceae bacterium]|nr:hypothetical protein [Bacteroidaceae bacterium]